MFILAKAIDQQHLEVIEKAIEEIQFGEVQITIQDGKIVQINRLEKHRFSKTSPQNNSKQTIK